MSHQRRQFNKIVKSIDKLYDSNIHTIIKNATPNDKKYLAAIISNQRGGNSSSSSSIDISLIASGNREIKQIVENLKSTTKSLLEELELTKQENKILKDQIRKLDQGVQKLDKTKCKEKMKLAKKYIEQFLQVRKAMIGLVSFIKKKVVVQSFKLKFLSKPPLEWEDDLENMQKIQIKNPTCENVQGILNELEEYQNPDILSGILNDFESISGSVRVIVRILNNSFINSSQRGPRQSFDYKMIQDKERNKTKKVKQNHTSKCNSPNEDQRSCLTPGSVEKDDKYVVRTPYPCINSFVETVPFRFRYGPFFNVFQNENNKTIFSSYESIIPSLERGNQIVTFGYGYSGSGKSYSLLGNQKEYGLFQATLREIRDKVQDITITVKELYGRIEPPSKVSRNKYENKIESKLINHGQIQMNTIEQVNTFLEQINKERRNNGQIKFTPNNPNSSRGHLMIQASVKFKSGVSTKFMTVDLAGSEDPFIIGQTFLRIDPLALKTISKKDVKMLLVDITNPDLKIKSTFWTQDILEDFSKKTKTNIGILNMDKRVDGRIKIKITQENNKQINQIMNKLYMFYFVNILFGPEFTKIFQQFKVNDLVEYIWNMITEGFYINETLNHLKLFLQRESDKKVHIIRASESRVPKGIVYKTITANEMRLGADITRYSPDKLLVNPDIDDSIGLLKLVEKFKRDDKATNYVMIATIRDELSKIHCSGTSATLDFAHQVKST
jgi:hypothetical protein